MTAIDSAIGISKLTDDDLLSAHHLSQAFGWPHRVEDWRMMLRLGTGFAARDGEGQLLGSAVLWSWSDRLATAGLIIVRRDRHGHGIGQRLLARLIEAAGHRTMRLYATPEGRKLYERQGFVPSGRIVQMQCHISSRPQVRDVRPADPTDRSAIFALDAASFGVGRDRLFEMLRDCAEFRVLGPIGAPVGFAARRQFGRGNLIGPVVAPDAGSARDLIGALIEPGFNRLDLTPAAAPILSWLGELGFEQAAIAEEMTRGSWSRQSHATAFALASQSFG